MTIQTGGFNAEYRNAMSGVINIVTKNGSAAHELWTRIVDDRIRIEKTNKKSEWELLLSGPLYQHKIGYFISSNIIISDTRWYLVPGFAKIFFFTNGEGYQFDGKIKF